MNILRKTGVWFGVVAVTMALGACEDDVEYQDGEAQDNNATNNATNNANNDGGCATVDQRLEDALAEASACGPDGACQLADGVTVCQCGSSPVGSNADVAALQSLAGEAIECSMILCEPCDPNIGPIDAFCNEEGFCEGISRDECAPDGMLGATLSDALSEAQSGCQQDADCGLFENLLCGTEFFGPCFFAVNVDADNEQLTAAIEDYIQIGCAQLTDCDCGEPGPPVCDAGVCRFQ